jgi:hypothetical protein
MPPRSGPGWGRLLLAQSMQSANPLAAAQRPHLDLRGTAAVLTERTTPAANQTVETLTTVSHPRQKLNSGFGGMRPLDNALRRLLSAPRHLLGPTGSCADIWASLES